MQYAFAEQTGDSDQASSIVASAAEVAPTEDERNSRGDNNSKKPPIKLPPPAAERADPPGLESGDEEAPPEDDGGFSTLGAEDPLPFDDSRLSYESRPKLEPDQNTGSLIYSFPLTIPPGRKGLQPDLALVYDSSSYKNEYLGRGWSINIPYIERINRSGVENPYTDDYFFSSFDGELRATTTPSEGESMSMGPGIEPELLSEPEFEVTEASSSIESLLEGKSSEESANIKAEEIAKIFPTGNYVDATYGITVGVESIEKPLVPGAIRTTTQET
jgi:hypothetical protein